MNAEREARWIVLLLLVAVLVVGAGMHFSGGEIEDPVFGISPKCGPGPVIPVAP